MKSTISNILLAGAAAVAAVSVSSTALAEPRTHDGFYFQGQAGLGYLSASQEYAGTTTTISGVTTPVSILLGGTVGPVVIGGGFFADHAAAPGGSVEGSGVSQSVDLPDVTMTLVGFGVFADIYPDPTTGLHFQPFLGYAALGRSYRGETSNNDPVGPVLAIGAGYDWWVGDEWSIGVMGRFAYAPLKFEAPAGVDSPTVSTIAPAILATFTYH